MILKRFCCCCDLRSGATFIGIIENLFALPAFILSFLSFGYRDSISEALGIPHKVHIIPLITIVLIFCSFMKLCSCILLISGATRRCHFELMPWLIIECIGMLASFVIFLILMVVAPRGFGLPLFFCGNIIIGISVYWWLCVYSLYQQFQKEDAIKHHDMEVLIET